MSDFVTFALIGFLAQIVDGSLGMGFGVISSSILLAQGVPPALASASVNAAKLPTTGTAAASHFFHKNIDWSLVRALSIFGALGGILGALLLTSLKGKYLSLVVNSYLVLMGVLIIWRGIMNFAPRLISPKYTRSVGFAGGLIEGIGGSWGPIVTTSLLGAGAESRYAIGSGNFSEFVVSVAVFSFFVVAFAVGHWSGGADWRDTFLPVLGLVIGGIPAAIFGGYLSKHAPKRPLTIAVGCLALSIAVYRALFA
ncbi:MAG: sulfite exporter TauE/SafE family protein [Hyphomicrobiales bacterium]